MIRLKNKDALNERWSMHLIDNAWHDVQFCDPNRNIHGATLAELLHCLQLGIYKYIIDVVFSTKQIRKRKVIQEVPEINNSNQKKRKVKFQAQLDATFLNDTANFNEESDEDDEYEDIDPNNLSTRNVFPVSYHERFESLCKKYGKMLEHQSDRNKPRTHFNSSYMTHTKKNGHEMSGLILVYLIVFAQMKEWRIWTNNLVKIDAVHTFICLNYF